MKKHMLLPGLLLMILLINGCSTEIHRSTPPQYPYQGPNPDRAAQPPVQTRPLPPAPRSAEPQVTRPAYRHVPAETAPNPYERIPTQADTNRTAPVASNAPGLSVAAQRLRDEARTDLASGRPKAAVDKLERALRINPRHPGLWHDLAAAHDRQGNYSTAISMAQKSNIYAAQGSAVEKANWQLIKSASQKSGNIKLLKQALKYERANP